MYIHTTQILCFEMTLTAAVQPDTSSSYFGSNRVSRQAGETKEDAT